MLNKIASSEGDPRRPFTKYMDEITYRSLDDRNRKQLHEAWRHDPQITAKTVMAALGLNTNQYYGELDRLGVEYTKKNYPARKKRAKLATAKKQTSCCTISFSGLYDPQQLAGQIEAIKNAINPAALQYFQIKIEEKKEE